MSAIALTPAVSVESSKSETALVTEVVVRWGNTVLGIAHVDAKDALRVGENDRGTILVPAERLGTSSFALIERGELRIPRNAVGTIEMSGERRALSEVVEERIALTSRARLVLGEGDDAIVIEASRVKREEKPAGRAAIGRGLLGVAAASLLVHAMTVGALAFSPARSLDDDNAPLDRSTAEHIRTMTNKAYVRELPKIEETGNGTKGGVDLPKPGEGEAGKLGTTTKSSNGKLAVPKSPDLSAEEKLTIVRNKIMANDIGAIGALAKVFASTGPIDAGAWNGHDSMFAAGDFTGPQIGDVYSSNPGLTLKGPGNGGGGDFGFDIGMKPIFSGGDPNGTWGTCTGPSCGKVAGTHKVKPPKIIDVDTSVTGSLPRETVQRIVRANFPRLRACYETGLKKDPNLAGRVATRFIIDSTGAVESASLSSSTLGDAQVASCVVSVFNTMAFPAPANGKAMVVYPIDFAKE